MNDDFDVIDPIEAYCVRCRGMIEIESPKATWTRRGMPATRGECPDCGGTVFRMGKTDLHDMDARPAQLEAGTSGGTQRIKLAQETVYLNFALADEEFAELLAADLQRIGIACWLHDNEPGRVNWAGGTHPALTTCTRMVLVLSPHIEGLETVETAWHFFKSKGKPIVIAQVAPSTPPDALRRSARFDFASDYRSAFREMLQMLSR